MTTERTRAVKKNIIGSILIKGISIITGLVLVPLTIGYVSSELYGVWITLASIMTWLSFMDIGFTQGLKIQIGRGYCVGRLATRKSID